MISSPRSFSRPSGQLFLENPRIGRTVALPFLFACLLFTAGCGSAPQHDTPLPQPPPSSPPPAATQSGSVTISPQYIAVAQKQKYQFAASASGPVEWLVDGVRGGDGNVGTIDSAGNYTAPAFVPESRNVIVTAALASSPQQNYATSVVSIMVPGYLTCPSQTKNPQVAQYVVYLPAPGHVQVDFGTTTSYGLKTWNLATPSPNGGQVRMWIAGMLGQTKYHIQGRITLDDGATFTDADQTCQTGTPPTTAPVQISTPSGATPQPGIELWNTVLPAGDSQAFATDLKGNVIWTYSYSHPGVDIIQGVQLLPNGDMLMLISYLSSLTLSSTSGVIDEAREIDLAGNTVRDLTVDQLNKELATSNLRDAQGNLYKLRGFHHDVLALPNGHWVILADYSKNYTNLPGHPGTTKVLGDAIIDVDQNLKPDWAWNTFDHLDINRHPMAFPDWTHGNNLLYSTDDHNLLFSMRHQNWIIKINFLDGLGSGDVMWRLGEGGDFKLVNGVDPTDWFYAQHGMSYFSPNTTGVFRIGLMDNGNDRLFPTGQAKCQPFAATTPDCYSTIPVFEVNEENMTATLITHYVPPPSFFSFFGGNGDLLPNGDIEADFCAPLSGGIVQELTPNASQVVWQGATPGADQFHAFRLPSLYPGVQW
ncbi:MAG TPA: aryl-sulfate sulfotransferase [Terracidiphilus sp.]|nr:aryl-sulfate sulfotransferase [Terracidiphilus sp.]